MVSWLGDLSCHCRQMVAGGVVILKASALMCLTPELGRLKQLGVGTDGHTGYLPLSISIDT